MRHKKFEIRILKDKDTGNKTTVERGPRSTGEPYRVFVFIHKPKKKSRRAVLRFHTYEKHIYDIMTELKGITTNKYSMSYALLYVNHENNMVKRSAKILLEVK